MGETNVKFCDEIGLSEALSSNEDLSQYTDADESISAPTEILAEFLSAIMLKDYSSAFKYCKIILQYEPNHETAKEFYPLLQQKLFEQENGTLHHLSNNIDEESAEDDSDAENGNNVNTESSASADAEETTDSYSSLEDEVVEPYSTSQVSSVSINESSSVDSNGNPLSMTSNATMPFITSQMSAVSIQDGSVDSNGNPISNTPNTTSDSDSFPETKKVSSKLRALLHYKHRGHKLVKIKP